MNEQLGKELDRLIEITNKETLMRTSIPKEGWNVHGSHCSKKHCKYGDKDCPVVLGLTYEIHT